MKVYIDGYPDDYNIINGTIGEKTSQIYIHRLCLHQHIICLNSSSDTSTTTATNNILQLHTFNLIFDLLPLSTITPSTVSTSITSVTTLATTTIPYQSLIDEPKPENPVRKAAASVPALNGPAGICDKGNNNQFKITYIKSCM